jgi:UDP-N-acetylmuramate: L-alanyl-gamma-D-glutamyl-meso-diaminopimelate ligase
MNIHFISIGGSVMHNLAISLHNLGHKVTGSDDEIYDPSRSILEKVGLLPREMGWKEDNIHTDLDCVILGMHAKDDNPELIKAQQMGIKVYSYPEYIYQHAIDKKRIVVAGSHGKTTTTSMIMHILKESGADFDYLVGARLEGFSSNVKLSDASIIVIEGDEYLSSAIDRRPKMLHYSPDLLVITGIEWDHINVFPSEENYIGQFRQLLNGVNQDTVVFYDEEDEKLVELVNEKELYKAKSYKAIPLVNNEIESEGNNYPLQIFGHHNMKNLSAAVNICLELGISEKTIFEAASSFLSADKRLNLLYEDEHRAVYKDFAHAPSKVRATVNAVRAKYPKRKLFCILELHTYSSLNKSFIPLYNGVFEHVNKCLLTYNKKTLEIKKMEALDKQFLVNSFGKEDIVVYTNRVDIEQWIVTQLKEKTDFVLLIMTSGHLGGIDLGEIIDNYMSIEC